MFREGEKKLEEVYVIKNNQKKGYLQRDNSICKELDNSIYFNNEKNCKRFMDIYSLTNSCSQERVISKEINPREYRIILKDDLNILEDVNKVISKPMDFQTAIKIVRIFNERKSLDCFHYAVIDEFTPVYNGIVEYLGEGEYDPTINKVSQATTEILDGVEIMLPSFISAEEIRANI